MIEQVPSVKRLNRRTRGERNKRRERYLIFNNSNSNDSVNSELADDLSVPKSEQHQTTTDNNNFDATNNMANLKSCSKMKSAESTTSSTEQTSSKTIEVIHQKEKYKKKVIIPPKSLKQSASKLKKPNLIIRKFKLPLTKKFQSKSSKLNASDASSSNALKKSLKRQTPEGDEQFMLTKSVSETNLIEPSEKSVENLIKDNNKTTTTTRKATESEITDSSRTVTKSKICLSLGYKTNFESDTNLPERTKSLENLLIKMPAYGDLIVDSSPTTSNLAKTSERKDHLYKILVIGDLGGGKTSIIKRYVHRFFTQHYRATIGVDFALKVLNWDENTLIRLQLWDIAGQERYGNMTRVYYKEAVGAFIVFDVTRVNTFDSVAKWKSDLDSKVQLSDGSPIPCVLLANKCDQPKEGLVNNSHKMDEYCRENGFTAWFETSAKDNINIDEAAKALVTKILENDTLLNVDSKDEDKFSITKHNNQKNNDKSCSC